MTAAVAVPTGRVAAEDIQTGEVFVIRFDTRIDHADHGAAAGVARGPGLRRADHINTVRTGLCHRITARIFFHRLHARVAAQSVELILGQSSGEGADLVELMMHAAAGLGLLQAAGHLRRRDAVLQIDDVACRRVSG